MSTIRLPSGVRDFLPRAAARRRALADRAQAVFEAWGYQRVITPYFEVSDVLERGLGASARAAAVRFVEPGTGQIVALRPDITPQIARIVATRMGDVPPPLRLCYEGAVTRLAGEAGQREVLQAGIELVGAPDRDADAEVLAVAWSVVRALDLSAQGRGALPEVRIDLGHVAPAAYVLAHAAAPERLAPAIARKDRASVRAATDDPLAHALVTLWGPADDVLARARALAWPAAIVRALDELAAVIDGFRDKVGEHVDVTIDLGDLRGFDYYTGMKLAVYAGGAPDAIARGGRYDELLGKYGREMHAVGFALDLEAVAQAQRQAGVATPRGPIGVAVGDPALARALRAAGLRVVIQADVDSTWLRGAGLDAAIVGDHLTFADDSRRPAKAAIEAAAAGDTGALIALLQAT